MPNNPLETYLHDLCATHSSGAATPETSYYHPLAALLNTIGQTLTPKVRCIMGLRDQGAGFPDGGLFTPDQLQQGSEARPRRGQLPARGAIEVKPVGDNIWLTADAEQVSRYWATYRQVLVTNHRDFLLVGQDPDGNPVNLEAYHLADHEVAFWAAVGHPRQTLNIHGERFIEYLKRVMLHAAPLADPKDVAWFLASYASDAKARIESANPSVLTSIRRAFEEALGMGFQGYRGEQFFRSSLVQTLFYGIFSAWVLWSKQYSPTDRGVHFDWGLAARYLPVPILRKLFYEVADPGQLEALNLPEVLHWAGAALNRVDRAAFFEAYEEGRAIQYFYEPFLEAFDPALRRQLGVWYTPPEVVQYMVARVETVLREELGIEDGFADPRVYVLDPCCGTGAYLVEVLKRIATTLQEHGGDALLAHDVKRAAMKRVFGFEILPAPFVVAHLQLGLLLQTLGVPLSRRNNERISVYLTNALTGWEPPTGPKASFTFPEFEAERVAAERVKREVPILVILGNPPYDGFADVAVAEERGLSDAYRTTTRAPAPQGQGLNNPYVRFFRMAERRIVEQTGQGVVCFISNYSWLDHFSFTGMRERYLEVYDSIWIDNLHGDRIISEYAPDGRSSETIFALQGMSPGIKVGTAISLFVVGRDGTPPHRCRVFYRDMHQARAAERRAALLESLDTPQFNDQYAHLEPVLELGLLLKPGAINNAYLAWPRLPDLFPVSFSGVKTSRDEFLVDIDPAKLHYRVQQYLDPSISDDELRRMAPSAMRSTNRFNASLVRDYLLRHGVRPPTVVRYSYRPFDVRWLYWEPHTKLLDEKRAEYFPHVFDGNVFLFTTARTRKSTVEPPLFTRLLNDMNCLDSSSRGFPLYLRTEEREFLQSTAIISRTPNLSDRAADYLTLVDATEQDLFYHCMSMLHSPAYRRDHRDALRHDWPRVPLPEAKSTLLTSARLGRQVAALLDTEGPVLGVTAGRIRPELRFLSAISHVVGGHLNPAAGDLAVTAGWGYTGRGGITMPGTGKILTRPYTPEELAAIEGVTEGLGLPVHQIIEHLGDTTYDVSLNDVAYWRNVPEKVWHYTVGGYQVIKKWLSYRECELLGRPLLPQEARHVRDMVRRIAALLLLEPILDANYQMIHHSTTAWPS